jgi:hypothetical protein
MTKLGQIFAWMAAVMLLASAPMGAAPPVVVVYGNSAGWLDRHAAEEFARYAQAATGSKVALRGDDAALPAQGDLVLLGSPAANRRVAELVRQGVLPGQTPEGEGFVVRTANQGRCRLLHLAGGTDVATLYAVYDYLERDLGCGWFPTGDYVPKGAKLVMSGLSRSETPRFKWRHFSSGFGYWAIKFESTFWDWPEWQRYLDWAAKSKLNLTQWSAHWAAQTAGTVPRKVFPEMGKPAEEPAYQLKVEAARQFYQTIQPLSPDALWVTDSWDFGGSYWTPQAIAQYFADLPKDMRFLIYDTNADYIIPPQYEKYQHWFGRNWAFAVLQTMPWTWPEPTWGWSATAGGSRLTAPFGPATAPGLSSAWRRPTS